MDPWHVVFSTYFCAGLTPPMGDGIMLVYPKSHMAKFTLLDATPEKQCDNCAFQEGRHYCLQHSQQVRNMDAVRCMSWKAATENPDEGSDESVSVPVQI